MSSLCLILAVTFRARHLGFWASELCAINYACTIDFADHCEDQMQIPGKKTKQVLLCWGTETGVFRKTSFSGLQISTFLLFFVWLFFLCVEVEGESSVMSLFVARVILNYILTTSFNPHSHLNGPVSAGRLGICYINFGVTIQSQRSRVCEFLTKAAVFFLEQHVTDQQLLTFLLGAKMVQHVICQHACYFPANFKEWQHFAISVPAPDHAAIWPQRALWGHHGVLCKTFLSIWKYVFFWQRKKESFGNKYFLKMFTSLANRA